MTISEKLEMLHALLSDGGALPSDDKLTVYLNLAEHEILTWIYHNIGGVPENATLPSRYEVTQIYAVVAGFTHAGAEGEKVHNENGVSQTFLHSDMMDYIRQNVWAYARVGAV